MKYVIQQAKLWNKFQMKRIEIMKNAQSKELGFLNFTKNFMYSTFT